MNIRLHYTRDPYPIFCYLTKSISVIEKIMIELGWKNSKECNW